MELLILICLVGLIIVSGVVLIFVNGRRFELDLNFGYIFVKWHTRISSTF